MNSVVYEVYKHKTYFLIVNKPHKRPKPTMYLSVSQYFLTSYLSSSPVVPRHKSHSSQIYSFTFKKASVIW